MRRKLWRLWYRVKGRNVAFEWVVSFSPFHNDTSITVSGDSVWLNAFAKGEPQAYFGAAGFVRGLLDEADKIANNEIAARKVVD